MIDLDKAKKEFEEFSKKYNLDLDDINRKYYHSYRVSKISRDIAKSINLNEEEVQVAELIGLLHDIGRFEQWKIYHTFSDKLSIDHGDFGVEILKKDNLLRKFNSKEEYDNIIIKAIRNHNKFKIEPNLNEQELLYSKIIKDADKLDIFYEEVNIFYATTESKEKVENGIISQEKMEELMKKQLLLRKKDDTKIDELLTALSFTFDLNFKYSFEILQNEDYINKIIDRFNFTNKDTKEKIEEIRIFINDYINTKNRG